MVTPGGNRKGKDVFFHSLVRYSVVVLDLGNMVPLGMQGITCVWSPRKEAKADRIG